MTYLALGIVLTLAVVRPLPLSEEANPFRPVELDPDWYLVGARRVLEALPGPLSALVLLAVPLAFVGLPFLDRKRGNGAPSAPRRVLIAAVLTIGFAVLTWGFR
jgi:quinol-cytochrome oxidoreductase complex cytochrome b subunit